MTDLLTTKQVQDMLHVDRTTIYRMVESGQLPGIRVGKQWRFAQIDLERWLRPQSGLPTPLPDAKPTPAASPSVGVTPTETLDSPAGHLSELLPLATCQMLQDAFAEMLGVTIVVTDMQGRPATQVSNPCGLYSAMLNDVEAVMNCIQDWQRVAGVVPLEPRFSPNDLGLLCARGLIRFGNELKGMVFFGGIAPDVWPPSVDQIGTMARRFGVAPSYVEANIHDAFHLDRVARDRVLRYVQRVADIFSRILEDRNTHYAGIQTMDSLTALGSIDRGRHFL